MLHIVKAFQKSFCTFAKAPLKDVLTTLLFLIGLATGLFAGFSIIAYSWFLARSTINEPKSQQHPFLNAQNSKFVETIQFTQYLTGPHRLRTLTALGGILWGILFISILSFGFDKTLLGIPLYWYFCQPILLLIIIANAYAIKTKMAVKVALHFIFCAPLKTFILLLLHFLAFSGLWVCLLPLYGVENYLNILILITIPLALRTSLLYFNSISSTLNICLQKAYNSCQ